MKFNSSLPSPKLKPYIEYYWLLSGYLGQKEVISLMPDTAINFVLNLGEVITSLKFDKDVNHEQPYLVGTMQQTEEQVLSGKVLLFGIRFRPGAFTHFYQLESLQLSSNQFHEFDRNNFPDIKKTIQYFVAYIDQFFIDRLSPPRHAILDLVLDITSQSGPLKIYALAKKHFMTERQLERLFNQQIGISPKEFINLKLTRCSINLQTASADTI